MQLFVNAHAGHKCLIVGAAVAALAIHSPAWSNLEDGKYGAAQVFDVQRSPPTPVANQSFTVSSMSNPFGNGEDQVGQYTMTNGQYIQFEDVDTDPTTCNYEINLYNSDGTFNKRISSGGDIYGLGEEGFLHVSTPGDFGTFVANSAGFDQGDSLTYTPDTGLALCTEVEAYSASTTPTATAGAIPAGNSVPDAPTIDSVIAGDQQATVTFSAPADDGGAVITSYTATSSPGGITASVSQAGSGSITVTGLTNGTEYTFTVAATNAEGTGQASAASDAVTPVAAETESSAPAYPVPGLSVFALLALLGSVIGITWFSQGRLIGR